MIETVGRQLKMKHSLLISIGLVTAFAFLIKLFFVQTFKTNDDVGMSMICSGSGYALVPDEHIMYGSIIVGRMLANLYEFKPHFPWYGCYLAAINLLGITAVLSQLVHRSGRAFLIPVGFFFLAICINTLVLMQFTTAACMIALGGCLLVLGWLEDGHQFSAAALLKSALGIVLLIISSLVRHETFVLFAILFLTLCTVRFVPKIRPLDVQKNRAILLAFSSILLAGVIAISLFQYNNWKYKTTPGWQDFYAANLAASKFNDFGLARKWSNDTRLAAERAVAWTENDYGMLFNLFTLDNERFSLQKMDKANAILKNPMYSSIHEFWNDLSYVINHNTVVPITVSCLLLLLTCKVCFLSRLRLLLLGALIFGLMVTLMLTLHLPEHVFFPIFSFYLVIVLYYIDWQSISQYFSSPPKASIVCLLCAAAFLGLSFAAYENYYVRGQRILSRNKLLREAIIALAPSKDNLYVVWRDFFPYEMILPFDDLSQYFGSMRILPLAWRASAPLPAKRMQEFDMTLTNFGEKMTAPNIYLVSGDELNPLMKVYLKEHYGLDTEIKLFKEFVPLNLRIYKIVRAGEHK